MSALAYTLDDDIGPPPIGMIVLEADESLEPEFRHLLADTPNALYVSRIASPAQVTRAGLLAMEEDLTRSAALLPDLEFGAVGYGCTSASAIIGSDEIERQVRRGCRTRVVTDPVRAAAARAAHLGVSRFALVSPYIEEVNRPLCDAFERAGLEIRAAGSFGIAAEHDVVRISTESLVDAALRLGRRPDIEAVFLSCTNLRTLPAIPRIEAELGKPALSSNSVLAWHLKAAVADRSETAANA